MPRGARSGPLGGTGTRHHARLPKALPCPAQHGKEHGSSPAPPTLGGLAVGVGRVHVTPDAPEPPSSSVHIRLLINGPRRDKRRGVTIARDANVRPWAPAAKGTSARAISGRARNRPGSKLGGEAPGSRGHQGPGRSRPSRLPSSGPAPAPLPEKPQLRGSRDGSTRGTWHLPAHS